MLLPQITERVFSYPQGVYKPLDKSIIEWYSLLADNITQSEFFQYGVSCNKRYHNYATRVNSNG